MASQGCSELNIFIVLLFIRLSCITILWNVPAECLAYYILSLIAARIQVGHYWDRNDAHTRQNTIVYNLFEFSTITFWAMDLKSISYHIILQHIKSYIVSCIVSHRAGTFHTIPYHDMPCHAMPCHAHAHPQTCDVSYDISGLKFNVTEHLKYICTLSTKANNAWPLVMAMWRVFPGIIC